MDVPWAQGKGEGRNMQEGRQRPAKEPLTTASAAATTSMHTPGRTRTLTPPVIIAAQHASSAKG